MRVGEILGHEPMGVVEEAGSEVTHIQPGDRVVIPFNISCGRCVLCTQGLYSQCETTQVREHGMGGALFGYTKLYGEVAGGQAEFLRVPQAQFGAIKVPEGPPDDRFVYLSDILPTAWQAVTYADIPAGGSVAVFGLGPIGDMSCRVARHLGAGRIFGIDLVEERLDCVRQRDVEALDLREHDDIAETIRRLTEGRGPDSVIDAVGMEAHGDPVGKLTHQISGLLPDPVARAAIQKAGLDRLTALRLAIDTVRRGGTISITGVYGGMLDPLPMLKLFDKQIQLRMGQANVRRWTDDILPLTTTDDDVRGLETFATHHLPLSQDPTATSSSGRSSTARKGPAPTVRPELARMFADTARG
jgi:threonine dehydrogenase-like Zn-dependent dehydrogenase